MEIDKKELHEKIQKIKTGDKSEFKNFYEEYYLLVYKIAFSILKNAEDTQDIAQNVFTKLYEIEEKKLPEKNEASWLYTVTKNQAIDLVRKKKKEVTMEEIYKIEEENDEIKKITERESFNQILSRLDETEKQIVSLKIISQLSFKEIATLLNLSIGVVSWKYYQSLHTLKTLLMNIGVFVITFAITLRNNKKKEQNTETQRENENVTIENNTFQVQEDKVEEQMKQENVIKNQEEIIIQEEKENINFTKIEGSILVVSIIGFVIFLTIFLKQQLRKRKNSRK